MSLQSCLSGTVVRGPSIPSLSSDVYGGGCPQIVPYRTFFWRLVDRASCPNFDNAFHLTVASKGSCESIRNMHRVPPIFVVLPHLQVGDAVQLPVVSNTLILFSASTRRVHVFKLQLSTSDVNKLYLLIIL